MSHHKKKVSGGNNADSLIGTVVSAVISLTSPAVLESVATTVPEGVTILLTTLSSLGSFTAG